ncbi:ATP-binding protein [Microlunatus ginsengisoli]|uniref:ATP-binding protein n=1 Tax=Microlunatus ginsengisoli TaxID=363863 RepID=UPI0031D013C5
MTTEALPRLTPRELRDRRHQLGLTQSALAAALGVTVTTIARWERGERAISTPLLVRLALDHLETQPVMPAVERIPAPDVALVGRSRELAAVRRLIGADGARLVTFVGPGGAGKSVLALEAGRRAAAERSAGGCLVELADLTPGSAIEATVGRALGVRDRRGGSIADSLVRALHGTDLVLVLDNCEHVSGSAGTLVAAILRRCPAVTVLATSRAPLRIRPEHRLAVDPLAVPDLSRHQSPAALLQVPSVRLFVDRRRAVDDGYRLSGHDARPVAEICVRLDGLPLALELAAAGAGAMQPAELLNRLPQSGGSDRRAPVDLPDRHRSLDSVLDWSYRLLEPIAQLVFRRLAIFTGSFDHQCAIDLIGDDLGTEPVRDALAHLIDVSLVAPLGGSSTRLRMLETVRTYAVRLLTESGERPPLAKRHADWFTAWAERGAHRFENAAQAAWLDALDVEFGNVRAALTWCLSPDGDPKMGLRLATAVRRYWDMRGLPSEGETTLAAMLARDPEPSPVRLDALVEMAGLATRREDVTAVERCANEAEHIGVLLGDPRGRALGLASLTYAAYMRGDPATASAIAAAALVCAEDSGDAMAVSLARLAVGVAALGSGRLSEALAQFTMTCDAARSRGDLWLLSECNDVLASTLIALGDFARARAAGVESLLARLELRNLPVVPINLRMIGIADAELGVPERAAVLFGAAIALEHTLGTIPHTQWAQDYRHALEITRVALGERRFTHLWTVGRHASETEIRVVARGLPSALIDDTAAGPNDPPGPLSPRELAVARLFGEGLTSREIAHRLGISERTVGSHTEHIMIKLGVHTRAQISAWVERSHAS